MNLIAIDFSITSTAICIKSKGRYHWYSFVSNLNFDKKAFSVHKDLLSAGINVIGYERNKPKDLDYPQEQSFKLRNADDLADIIINAIAPYTYSDTIIAIEGFSYGSKGNAFIDIITYNTFLKSKIMGICRNPIQVYPPKTIKKHFTGNGNANKPMMVEEFMKRGLIEGDPFKEYLNSQSFGDNIPKPIDDLVDAFGILNYLEDQIN